MTWHKGLSRIRYIGIVSLVMGVIMLAGVWSVRAVGIEADPVSAFFCSVVWSSGITLLVLGNVLWIALWVAKGFVPPSTSELTATASQA